MAAADCCEAAACCAAPRLICSSAVRICAEERLISSTALDNSSAAEATSSALLPMLVLFFSSSESSASSWAACSLWLSAWLCCTTVLVASSQAAPCSSAAAAITSDPFCASTAARLDSSLARAISRQAATTAIASTRIVSSPLTTSLPLRISSRAALAELPMPSAIEATSFWIWPINSWMSRADFSLVSASVRTSSATTAKPLPCWPARAASMAAFNASRLVWSAMRATAFTTSPIAAAWRSSSCTILTEASWRSDARPMASIDRLICPETSTITLASVSVRKMARSAFSLALKISPAPWLTAFSERWAALAACSAPTAICSAAARNSSAAEVASAMPDDSSVVAEAMRSAAICWRAKVRALRFCASAARRPCRTPASASSWASGCEFTNFLASAIGDSPERLEDVGPARLARGLIEVCGKPG